YIFSTLGRWQLSAGSQQRSWGIFSAGLVLGPAIILVLEILAGAVIVLLGILYISLRPDLQQQMALLGERINAAGNSPDAILKLLEPYLFNPLVLLITFAFLSGVVPLIEEALKPIGVWLVAGSHLTAAQGFAAGLISGSGYALFENLALSNTGSDWTVTLIGRIGTGLLHITTAGLTGWALVTAINQRRYLRLGAVYLLAVLIHGLWNALALVSAASGLDLTGTGSLGVRYADLARLSQWATVGLSLLVVVIFLILMAFNRSMRRQARSEVI
ncbi:MAG TPA: PrsW family glutamic-type intramembrane protease, partial [Anaerolineales bacterium]